MTNTYDNKNNYNNDNNNETFLGVHRVSVHCQCLHGLLLDLAQMQNCLLGEVRKKWDDWIKDAENKMSMKHEKVGFIRSWASVHGFLDQGGQNQTQGHPGRRVQGGGGPDSPPLQGDK